jgi:hypothetical protein
MLGFVEETISVAELVANLRHTEDYEIADSENNKQQFEVEDETDESEDEKPVLILKNK